MTPESDVSREQRGLPSFNFIDGSINYSLLPLRVPGIPRITVYEPRNVRGVSGASFFVREVSRGADRQEYRLRPSSGKTAGGKYLSSEDSKKGFVLGVVIQYGQISVFRQEQVRFMDPGFKGDLWIAHEKGLALVRRDIHSSLPVLEVPLGENLAAIPCLGAKKGVILVPSGLITQPSEKDNLQNAINRLAEEVRLPGLPPDVQMIKYFP